MYKIIILIISTIISSFYYFPFELVYFPGINTKMVMAAICLLLLPVQMARKGLANIDWDFLWISVLAVIISLIAFFSITYNNTIDISYAGYIISMWVWLGGAYTLIYLLNKLYGYLSVELVVTNLMRVCVIQCILALIINYYIPFKNFVKGFLGGEAAMGVAEGRIYGIGASLDTAGMRISAVLVMVAFLMAKSKFFRPNIGWYMIAFFFVAIVGNMIARTTTVGLLIAITYWIYYFISEKDNKSTLWKWFLCILITTLFIVILLYNNNQTFYNNFRFAFEGFFSLWEQGQWQVDSNDILINKMIVFPDNIRTWIIGDGYMIDPSEYDVNYIGETYKGYYKGTDVGYLRFIFYFGIVGLLSFVVFIIKNYLICARKFVLYKMMFFLVLLVNFIVWFKVSTDIFVVFALFLVLDNQDTSSKSIFS